MDTPDSQTDIISYPFHIFQAVYPLVTALLCISQKPFFLSNWGGFLNMCLNSIKVCLFFLLMLRTYGKVEYTKILLRLRTLAK